jgi:hypothetical protein
MEEFLSFFLKQVRGLGFAASAFLLLIGVAVGRDDSQREFVTRLSGSRHSGSIGSGARL